MTPVISPLSIPDANAAVLDPLDIHDFLSPLCCDLVIFYSEDQV
jgi:hypothetical protein